MANNQAASGFAATLASVEGVEGWMSDDQARRLWDAAARVSTPGQIVEIGSFRGRSTIVLATAAAEGVSVVAIDPHGGGDRGPNEIAEDAERGDADHQAFTANLAAAGVSGRVRHVRKRSDAAAGDVSGAIEVLYIDGAHRYAPARDDIAEWGARVAPGGTLLIHDAFNAIGVTAAQLRLLVFGSQFEYIGRSGSLVEYRRHFVLGADRVRNTRDQVAQLGYFARMVAVKCALAAKAYPVAKALGHPSRDWPY